MNWKVRRNFTARMGLDGNFTFRFPDIIGVNLSKFVTLVVWLSFIILVDDGFMNLPSKRVSFKIKKAFSKENTILKRRRWPKVKSALWIKLLGVPDIRFFSQPRRHGRRRCDVTGLDISARKTESCASLEVKKDSCVEIKIHDTVLSKIWKTRRFAFSAKFSRIPGPLLLAKICN